MELFSLPSKRLIQGFKMHEALLEVLKKQKMKLKNGDVVVISSKVLALSQGRVCKIENIIPGKKAKSLKVTRYGKGKEDPRIIELVIRESDFVIPGTMLLTLKDGILIPEAGIDLSNIPKGFAVLWPNNPWKSAREIRSFLQKKFRVKKLGIVISDSHCQPLRWGVTGIAIAWAGIEGIEDARGQKDIYGNPLKITKKAVADNLTSSAMLLMGEAGEKIPFVLIRDSNVKFTNRIQKRNEIFIKPKDCIFNGIYNKKFLDLVKSKHL